MCGGANRTPSDAWAMILGNHSCYRIDSARHPPAIDAFLPEVIFRTLGPRDRSFVIDVSEKFWGNIAIWQLYDDHLQSRPSAKFERWDAISIV